MSQQCLNCVVLLYGFAHLDIISGITDNMPAKMFVEVYVFGNLSVSA